MPGLQGTQIDVYLRHPNDVIANPRAFESSAVAEVRFVHGRDDLSQLFADYSVSITFVREVVEDLLASYSYSLDEFCSLGNLIHLYFIDGVAGQIYCNVTDVQRDRDTITLTGIDRFSFATSALAPTAFGGWIGDIPDPTLFYQIGEDVFGTNVDVTDNTTIGVRPNGIIIGQEFTSLPAFLESFIEWAPTRWFTVAIDSFITIGGQTAYCVDRPNAIPAAVHTFADDEILDVLQYSRNISDLVTVAVAENTTDAIGPFTAQDDAAVDNLGFRTRYVDARVDDTSLRRLTGAMLAAGSSRKAPIVTIQTTEVLCGTVFVFPNVIVDMSNVTAPEFDGVGKCYVEKCDVIFRKNDTIQTITLSDARYSSMPQSWVNVPGARTWAQLPATQTWMDTLIDDIT